MQKKAKAYGADGIIVTNVTRRYRDTWRGEVFVQFPLTDVEALAFVYPGSVSYVPGKLKAWVEYTFVDSTDTWREVYRQAYSMKGEKNPSDAKTINMQWWLRRQHDSLVNNPNIIRSPVFDPYNRPTRVFPDAPFKVKISYVDKTQLVDEIRLDFTTAFEQIKYTYTDDNARIKKRFFKSGSSDRLNFEESIFYDSAGNVQYYEVDHIVSGAKKPHFKIEPVYYTEQEFDEILTKAIKEELGDLDGY